MILKHTSVNSTVLLFAITDFESLYLARLPHQFSLIIEAVMKNKTLKEKFKNNIFVKPLYRKAQRKDRPSTNKLMVAINIDNTYKLDGTDIDIKRQYIVNTKTFNVLPGSCENGERTLKDIEPELVNPSRLFRLQEIKMLRSEEQELNDIPKNSVNKLVQAERLVVIKNIPDHWLRVYPLPALQTERACSVIFRCVFCQMGLATVIVLWTVLWTFLIHSFEAPYEEKVSSDFKNEQNQLVIDLATELRQIFVVYEPILMIIFVLERRYAKGIVIS